jgi:hypothetical protein
LITGSHDAYQWIVWHSQFLRDLISAVPSIVTGKQIIITSFDSGPFTPSADETNRGWSVHSGLAYSPLITRIDALPYDQYDEWYIYPTPTRIGTPEVFINYAGFRLQYEAADIEMNRLLERFWLQLKGLAPESYLAEGDNLIFATRNIGLYEQARRWKLPRAEPI